MIEKVVNRCLRTQVQYICSARRFSSKSGEESALIDYTEVVVRGGTGGAGCSSRQNLIRNRVKPDGADGGNGGAIIFKSSKKKHDFAHIASKLTGYHGSMGSGSHRRGVRGDDITIPVPVGSIIGCQQSQQPLVALDEEGECFMAAKGGAGGKGNTSLSQELDGGDRFYCQGKEAGGAGELAELYLEMKIIADIGLVGLPNAGKSSLLRAVSSAKPKVAAYPFTTLRPHIGVVHYDGYHRLQMADIPGLIEGSSLGHGLGTSFLKHIERCKSLLYVVDMSNENDDPIETIKILEKELIAFNPEMSDRIIGIVANKIDLLHGPDSIIRLGKAFPQYPIMPVSALQQRNIIAVRKILEPFKSLYIVE